MNDSSTSPIPPCPQCAQLHTRVTELEALVRDLQERLNQNSSNSSIPPSANPLGAPKPVSKTPSGRKPGGQTGHPGHHRHRLPPERVNKIVSYVPTICTQCQAPLPAEPGPGDPEPSWHQVAELPELAAVITEHQGHARAALAVATSIVARFPWRSAPTSSGHGWPRQCLTSAAVIIWADGL